eukprot:gene20442-26524_t
MTPESIEALLEAARRERERLGQDNLPSQELTIVEQGIFHRTVNGELAYFGPPEHKYRSIIRCEDKVTLVNEGVLVRGAVLRVGCLQRLWQQAKPGFIRLEREAVAGSVVAIDAFQKSIPVRIVDFQTVELFWDESTDTLAPDINSDIGMADDVCVDNNRCPNGADVFISYRPWLSMRVISLKLSTDEWGLKSGWKLELEEV